MSQANMSSVVEEKARESAKDTKMSRGFRLEWVSKSGKTVELNED